VFKTILLLRLAATLPPSNRDADVICTVDSVYRDFLERRRLQARSTKDLHLRDRRVLFFAQRVRSGERFWDFFPNWLKMRAG
jgi:hypothetical protein